jgi:hypothetical protein
VNLYPFFESGIIVLIGAFSVYHVFRMLMPGSVNRARVSVAHWLERSSSGSWRLKVAARLRGAAPAHGCGGGCSSGCGGCRIAARIHSPFAGDDNGTR